MRSGGARKNDLQPRSQSGIDAGDEVFHNESVINSQIVIAEPYYVRGWLVALLFCMAITVRL